MAVRPSVCLLLPAVLLLAGCEAEKEIGREQLEAMAGGELKETVPISGKVSINGAPAAKVNIYAYTRESGREPAARVRTAEDGTYCWTTYQLCDGLPPGEYRLAFAHIPKEGKGQKEGEDLLRGKYKNPAKNNFTLVVKSGEPQTDVNYELQK